MGIIIELKQKGMTAKPVIDVLVAVSSLQAAKPRVLPALNQDTWKYWWYGAHLVFVKRATFLGLRTHQVHFMESGPELTARLALRDHLRAHPDDAARYAAIKRQLAD